MAWIQRFKNMYFLSKIGHFVGRAISIRSLGRRIKVSDLRSSEPKMIGVNIEFNLFLQFGYKRQRNEWDHQSSKELQIDAASWYHWNWKLYCPACSPRFRSRYRDDLISWPLWGQTRSFCFRNLYSEQMPWTAIVEKLASLGLNWKIQNLDQRWIDIFKSRTSLKCSSLNPFIRFRSRRYS